MNDYRKIGGLVAAAALMSGAAAIAEETGGKEIYAQYCTQCHGINGDGKGVNAAAMSVQPRSHIDKEEMSLRSDAELYKVIEQGGASINKSVLMPAWTDNLNEEQIKALVAHLRVLCCEK